MGNVPEVIALELYPLYSLNIELRRICVVEFLRLLVAYDHVSFVGSKIHKRHYPVIQIKKVKILE